MITKPVLKLKEVFTPGGQPSVTYVGREHLGLEDVIIDALHRGYAINVVTGSTKSGKTVLFNHVLGQSGESVSIEGGQVSSEEDFWEQLSYELDVGAQRVRKESGSTDHGSEMGLEAGPPLVKGRASTSSGKSRSHERSVTYNVNSKRASIQSLLDNSISLLVDDFHYIDKDAQKNIIRALKGAVFKGPSVILLAVPHRAFDPMTVEQELEGRFKHVEIPRWEMDDLVLIPIRGFDALNLTVKRDLIDKICKEGFGNPLLVQEICSELCIKNRIFETVASKQLVTDDKLELALAEIAKSKGFPKYSKLRQGPDAKKKRILREFKDGRSQDKYSTILTALAALGPLARTSYDELRSSLQTLLKSTSMPAKHEITSALINMSKVAREKIEGEPPLEWVDSEEALIITDPFLLFYMKWAEDHTAPGSDT